MKVTEVYPNLYLFTFPNYYEMCSTFFRIQEYYESPIKGVRGKYNSLMGLMDKYAYHKAKGKKRNTFTYFEDWAGFNVPGSIVNKFYKNYMNNFHHKEWDMIEALDKYRINFKNDEYYIIGVVEKDLNTIKHEVGHGLFYLNKEYKKKMLKLVNGMPKTMRKMAEKHLLNIGYCKPVLKDELHAYFSTGIRRGMICIWHHIIFQYYIQRFKRLFKQYVKEVKIPKVSFIEKLSYNIKEFIANKKCEWYGR